MNLKPHIKRNLLVFFKGWKINIISFLIFPMVLAFIYGTMNSNNFEGKDSEIKGINVKFNYNKELPQGKALTEVLSNNKISSIIKSDDNTDNFIVDINEDFSDIKIKANENNYTGATILKNFMEVFQNNINQYRKVTELVHSPQLQGEIISKLNKLTNESSFKEKIVEGYKTIGSREYFTMSIFTFSLMILIQFLARGFYKDKKEGIIRRSITIGSSKYEYFISHVISSGIIIFMITCLYMVVNRALNLAFFEGPVGFILIAAAVAIIGATLEGLIVSVIGDEKNIGIIMMILIMLPATVGGVFFNIDSSTGWLKTLSNISPNSLVLNSMKAYALTGKIGEIGIELLAMLGLSVVFIVFSSMKIKRKWEV